MADAVNVYELPGAKKSTVNHPPFGNVIVVTPRGPIDVSEVPGVMSLVLNFRESSPTIGILTYSPAEEVGGGLMTQMGADEAREFAASLIHLANQIDPANAS